MVEKRTGLAHGIVLAGAYPTGGSLLDELAPRPLLPVAQEPLITYSLRWMQGGGLPSATACANSATRAVRSHLRRSDFAIQIDFLEDWTPRGTAGCVRDAGDRTNADTFVIADGTTVPVVDLGELLAAHRASGAVATIVVGADAAGRLRPTGVYVFARSTIRFIPEGGFYDIKEKLIPRLYRAGEYVATHMASEMAPRAVSAESYLALNHWALERKPDQTRLREGFLEHGEAFVHETAIIDPSARLLGPALVGPCASIGVGATLVGPVSIGRRTTVGEGAVVSRSVVWSRCVVGKGAFVDRSMLADGARVGTRELVVAALRADGRRIPQASATMRRAGRALWAPLGAALRPPTTNER